MADAPEDDACIAQMLLRYRLIADALEAPRGERTAILRVVAAGEHVGPDGKQLRVTVRTLQRWVARFSKQKLKALARPVRKDKGKTRAVNAAALARAVELRKEEPARSTPTLIDLLERAGEIAKGSLRRSTLDRHLDRVGASRRMLHVLGEKRHVRLAFDHPLDFVVGDFHDGPYIRSALGEIVRAKLSAFIDHCSRYVPESRYGMAEDAADGETARLRLLSLPRVCPTGAGVHGRGEHRPGAASLPRVAEPWLGTFRAPPLLAAAP
jgi:transposase